MKVKELIEQLSKLNPDLEVVIPFPGSQECLPSTKIDVKWAVDVNSYSRKYSGPFDTYNLCPDLYAGDRIIEVAFLK